MSVPILQRVENIEKKLQNVITNVDQMFGQVRNSVTSTLEVLEATLLVMGDFSGLDMAQQVQDKIKAKRLEREVERVNAEQAQLEQMVSAGALRVAEAVTNTSVLVGKFFEPDGTVSGAGRSQFSFDQITSDEFKQAVMGASVGFIYSKDGVKVMELLAVYEPNTVTPVAPPSMPEMAPLDMQTSSTGASVG
jgi:tetrahydromethanopterin S-methyltransferase subunit G